jgi:hypothetical protein
MGLLIYVYKHSLGDSTNGGISSQCSTLCLVNAEGPFEPSEERPAVLMQQHVRGALRIIRAYKDRFGHWGPDSYNSHMAGGNFGYTSDSRFSGLARKLLGHDFYGAVSIHDRIE